MKFNGCYFLLRQGGYHACRLRNLVTYAAYDSETWSTALILEMRRVRAENPFTLRQQIHPGTALQGIRRS